MFSLSENDRSIIFSYILLTTYFREFTGRRFSIQEFFEHVEIKNLSHSIAKFLNNTFLSGIDLPYRHFEYLGTYGIKLLDALLDEEIGPDYFNTLTSFSREIKN